jgi:hypothetical protein
MSKTPQEAIIAILIERLGGDVTISPREIDDADEIELFRMENISGLGMRFTTRRAIEVVGEIVDTPLELESE